MEVASRISPSGEVRDSARAVDDQGEGGLALERRVLARAHELAVLINEESSDEREVLREMAVNALRDAVVGDEVVPVDSPSGGGSFNPFGMAIPLVLVACLLVFLFPPVSAALFAGAGLMVVWGIVATLLGRS